VRAEQVSVRPHRRVVVHGAEVQQQTGVGRLWRHRDDATVPARAKERGVSNAARRRLRGERHLDALRPRHFRGVAPRPGPIEGEVPGTVQ
jgi:hypothetical protein